MAQPHDPNSLAALLATASLQFNRGEVEAAERICNRILRSDPDQPDVLHLMGLMHRLNGNAAAAMTLLRRAAALKPNPVVFLNLADVLMDNGEFREAEKYCRDVVASSPLDANAHYKLGLALHWLRDPRAAAASLREALRLKPDLYAARVDLGRVLLAAGDHAAARQELEHMLRLDPPLTNAFVFYGLACSELGDFATAEKVLRQALEHEQDPTPTLVNLANVYRDSGDFQRASEVYERVMVLAPENHDARNDYAHALLAQGQFARGWELYEARWEAYDHPRSAAYPQPAWNGEPLAGKRLLLWGEQGIGDQVMFAGIIAEVQAAAASCSLACHPKLVDLFARSFPGLQVVPANSARHAELINQPFDFQAPLASLARHFRVAGTDFPRHTGYLRADPGKVEAWKGRLAALGGSPKIGISWRGGTVGTRRHLRSIELAKWLPILGTPGIEFISLQYTDCAAELAALREAHGVVVHHWPEAIADYDETAALVCSLDRVVSVCTSLVHLTGALGRPAWVLVPAVPEWRYLREGESMPWYPSVRLHRQERIGEWDGVVGHIAGLLRG